jgi:GNAT superfamily N-acetyltransferase
MSLAIVPLRELHLADAAALVAARYKALRQRLPLLPTAFEDVDTILPLLRSVTEGASGVVAMRDSALVGFLSAFVIPEFQGKRSVYSPEWANAAPLGHSRRVYEEMYARLSARWVSDGCLTHLVTMLPNDDQGITSWQWLGFGMVAVDGVRNSDPVKTSEIEVEIRRAKVEDADTAMALERALQRHMAAAPTFWIRELRDYGEWLADPANVLWLAFEDGEPVGCLGLAHGNPDGCWILQDDQTVKIVSAFTKEPARGKGIATALLNRSLNWAHANGYTRCAVDFETMNVLAGRFWLKHFEPVCYALMRRVDERVATATG